MTKVELTRSVYHSLSKLPGYIVSKLRTWIAQIEMLGLREVRKYSGYHDEPLKGSRSGQRSIRLSHSYRAIYIESANGQVEIVTVIEVNKQEY